MPFLLFLSLYQDVKEKYTSKNEYKHAIILYTKQLI